MRAAGRHRGLRRGLPALTADRRFEGRDAVHGAHAAGADRPRGRGAAALAADASPKDIIAAQLRDQGYACDQPQSAVQDAEASKPDEAVWAVQCEDAKYRMRLVPDMAAKVERIDR